jgi:hypothetical protein
MRVVEWEWDGDSFLKSWSAPDVSYPQSRALGELANGDFVVYDWFTGRRLDVHPGADELQLGGPIPTVHARRAKP